MSSITVVRLILPMDEFHYGSATHLKDEKMSRTTVMELVEFGKAIFIRSERKRQ